MSVADTVALTPYLIVAGGAVVVLLFTAFLRRHGAVCIVTLLVFAAALISLPFATAALPRDVTPLFTIDRYALGFAALFLAAGFVTAWLMYRYLSGRRGPPEEFYVLLTTGTLGAMALAAAQHFAGLLLGLEMLSVSLYGLIAYPEEGRPPLEAAVKYLILSGVASTMLLFGAALIYAATGTLRFSDIVLAASVTSAGPYLILGQLLVLIGLAFKLSLVPFHQWAADVFDGAPAPVAGYLATVSKGAVAALLLRYLTSTHSLGDPGVTMAIGVVAALSMLMGNLLALMQQDLKRLLAYSSIAHFGYLLVPLLAIGPLAPGMAAEATLVYLAAYFAMTLAAFAIVTALTPRGAIADTSALPAFEGLYWRQPGLAAALTVVLLSLAGIPLTAGFIAEFYVFATGVAAALWPLLITLVIGGGLGLFYYLRVLFAMTRRVPPSSRVAEGIAVEGRWAAGLLAALVLAIGIDPGPLIALVRSALTVWGG